MGGIEHAQLLLGVVKIRAPVQGRRVPGKRRGTHGAQHAPCGGIAVGGPGEKATRRMALIALLDKAVQHRDVGAVVVRAELDLGQLRFAAAPLGQKNLFDALGPRQRVKYADLAGQTG
ncbi:hypothetical protein D3C77_608400 [compost metagenome]